MKWKKEHKMASMNIVPYHMGPYGHPYHQFDIHPSQFAHLSAQDAWHFSGTGQRLNQLYQEPYQAAAAASVAGGYQTQNSQDLVGGGGGGGINSAAGGANTNALFASAAAVASSTTSNADCVKYPQEF